MAVSAQTVIPAYLRILRLCLFWLICLYASQSVLAESELRDPLAADSETQAEASDAAGANILPSPIPRARWSEPWGLLFDPEQVYENWDLAFKRVALNASGSNFASFGGEFRLTSELYDPADRGLSDIGRQSVAMGRMVAHADWHPSERWRVFGQLGYSTASDREGGAKPGDKSDLNIWQMFVDGRFDLPDGSRLDIRLGRQIYEKANWFIGAGEARGVRQFYDGLRVAWLDESFAKFDLFAAEFVDAATGSFEMDGTDEYLWGASAGFRLEDPSVNLSLLYFGWDLKDRQFQQGGGEFSDERRHSIVGWANRPVDASDRWAFDYYFSYQFGRYQDASESDIRAFSAFGELKYALKKQVRTPIFGLKTSYFSGDSDPADDKLETFYNPVFVTVYFSFARDVQPHNLMHLQPNIAYRFSKRLQATLSTDFLWRESRNDAFYTTAGGIGISASAGDERYIGTQSQLALNWKPNRNLVATLYLARFWAGDFVEEGGGEDQTYFRVEFNYLL